MRSIFLKAYNFLGSKYLGLILNAEQRKRRFPSINERPVEYSFSFRHLQALCTGKVLDIGPGQSSWPHVLSTCGYDVKAIDKIHGYWNTFFNRHYKVENDDITNPRTTDRFQFATCLSVLEHIPDHEAAVASMHRLLEKGGYLILTFPYNEREYHPNIYEHPEAGYGQDANFVTQVYSRRQIDKWLEETSFEIIEQEYYQVFTGPLWTMGERIVPCLKTDSGSLHHLTCILFRKTED